MFFFEVSNKRGLWNIGHHDGALTRMKRSLAVVRFMSTVVLAARAFISWTIVNDMSKEVTYSAGIVVIFGARVMRRIEVSFFFIPPSPFQCMLIIEKSSLLLRELVEVFFQLRLSRSD